MITRQRHIEHSASGSAQQARKALLMAHKTNHLRRTSSRTAQPEKTDNMHLDERDLLSLIHALEEERLHAAPWQVSSLRHTLDTLTKIAHAGSKRGRA
jgi:hypothetical protein